jgi:hypothetical protein
MAVSEQAASPHLERVPTQADRPLDEEKVGLFHGAKDDNFTMCRRARIAGGKQEITDKNAWLHSGAGNSEGLANKLLSECTAEGEEDIGIEKDETYVDPPTIEPPKAVRPARLSRCHSSTSRPQA